MHWLFKSTRWSAHLLLENELTNVFPKYYSYYVMNCKIVNFLGTRLHFEKCMFALLVHFFIRVPMVKYVIFARGADECIQCVHIYYRSWKNNNILPSHRVRYLYTFFFVTRLSNNFFIFAYVINKPLFMLTQGLVSNTGLKGTRYMLLCTHNEEQKNLQ